MSSPLTARYKIPFLISLVIGLAVIVFSDEVFWYNAVLAFVGGIIGFLVLDLEYILHAYIIDPSSDISLKIKDNFANQRLRTFIGFLNNEEYTFGELSIRSALFQILLVVLSLMAVTGNTWAFAQGFVLSMAMNLLYFQFVEFLRTKDLKRWFWIYNGNLSTGFYKFYMTVIFLFLLYQFSFL